MGDMADFALDQAFDEQARAFDYVAGDMTNEEAVDAGLIDHNGEYSPALREALDWNDEQDLSHEGVVSALDRLADAVPFYHGTQPTRELVHQAVVNGRTVRLNQSAFENLRHDAPTCNECEHRMRARKGMYGKFYFCHNGCADQPTVSASYWLDVRQAFGVI